MKRKGIYISLLVLLVLGSSGCQMEKEKTVSSDSGQEVDIIKVEQRQEPDNSTIAEVLLNMTIEECKEKGGKVATEKGYSDNGACTLERFDYEDENNTLSVVRAVDDPYCSVHFGTYHYKKDQAGRAYEDTLINYGGELGADMFHPYRLRADYPGEELPECSKKEVIEKCQDFAEAAGYGNSVVNVYAMTADTLNRNFKENKGAGFGLPSGKYDVDQEPEEYMEHQKAWTKEYEAMYLVYRPVLHDVPLDSSEQELEIIYVPKYKRIVYAEWQYPFKDGTVVKKSPVVSKETAKQTVMTAMGIKDEKDIVFKEIQLENADTIQDTLLSDEHVLVPVWRVDYRLLNSAEYKGRAAYKTMLVNAVTGKKSQYALEEY